MLKPRNGRRIVLPKALTGGTDAEGFLADDEALYYDIGTHDIYR